MIHKPTKCPLYVLVRSRHCFEWTIQCLKSILIQDFHGFTILFVDDASDYTREQRYVIERLLSHHVAVFNEKRQYSLKNAYDMIHKYVDDPEAIIVNVDGDDYLSRRDALSLIVQSYQRTGCLLTYGECRLLGHSWWGDLLPSRFVLANHNTRYPSLEYRSDPPFRPLHPRTWKKWLFAKVAVEDFKDNKGGWFTTCEDQAMMFPMLEMSGGRYEVIQTSLYRYRIHHPSSDDVIHVTQQRKDERIIRQKLRYEPLYG